MSAQLIAGLAHAAAYPEDPSARNPVTHLQTHLSHVFLTGEKVYKLRKAVDLGFVCFATRAQRDADCVREVKLGRRLAPDVYLGVAPVGFSGRGAVVGLSNCSIHGRLSGIRHRGGSQGIGAISIDAAVHGAEWLLPRES